MNKAQIEKDKKKLFRAKKIAYDLFSSKEKESVFTFNELYKHFLTNAKTEREAALEIVNIALDNGFKNIDSILDNSSDCYKFFRIVKNRAVVLAVLGRDKSLSYGSRMICSHIDSPRLDLKQNPLYEDLGLSLLKTHYYGGIRNYQWLSIPLAIHGVIIKANGEKIEINIGERPEDPVFTISDLLPHLARKLQEGKNIIEVFDAEKLNLIIGSLPFGNEDVKERFKFGVMNLLYKEYGIVEEDLISADIEVVPAGPARDIGFDRSMIGAYGQDDRICAFTSLKALLDIERPSQTALAFFFDKEEIGSEGFTGAQSCFMEDFISDLLSLQNQPSDRKAVRKAMIQSRCLSADVNAAMDPDYKEVYEEMNAAKIGCGVCLTKFTGSGGKSGSSEADAEFIGWIRSVFNNNKIGWQTGELGKIDQGGGGTIAKFLARHGMDVVDCGPAILSMHAPFEISSKADVYMTYKGYKAFYESL